MIVIFYVMDSLRPDFLSCYGYEKETSPNIDSLSREGVIFRNAFSQATWTRPSGASLLTSTYPAVNGVLTLDSSLSLGIPSLPEQLKKDGFGTFAISSIANISPSFGFGNGFDRFIELYREEKVLKRREKLDFQNMGWNRNDFHTSTDYFPLSTSEDINEYLFPVLEKNRRKDTFVFIWSLDTHDPYFHRDMNLAKFCLADDILSYKNFLGLHGKSDLDHVKTFYEDMIYYNDHHLGELMKRLREMGIFDETFLIVTGDHGEAFGEHGFNSHGREPYDELLRVPLIMKFPYSNFCGEITGLVQHIDIMPTILDYLNIKADNAFQQGKSLIPLLEEGLAVNDFVFAEYQLRDTQPKYTAIRTDEFKYIELKAGRLSTKETFTDLRQRLVWQIAKPRMLFSLKDDPGEKVNVVNEAKAMAHSFHTQIHDVLADSMKRSMSVTKEKKPRTEVDETVAKQLKALGYFD